MVSTWDHKGNSGYRNAILSVDPSSSVYCRALHGSGRHFLFFSYFPLVYVWTLCIQFFAFFFSSFCRWHHCKVKGKILPNQKYTHSALPGVKVILWVACKKEFDCMHFISKSSMIANVFYNTEWDCLSKSQRQSAYERMVYLCPHCAFRNFQEYPSRLN